MFSYNIKIFYEENQSGNEIVMFILQKNVRI